MKAAEKMPRRSGPGVRQKGQHRGLGIAWRSEERQCLNGLIQSGQVQKSGSYQRAGPNRIGFDRLLGLWFKLREDKTRSRDD